ncbi:MAG: hypothetical protein R2911_19090 [Caldilineaceae bacterium]
MRAKGWAPSRCSAPRLAGTMISTVTLVGLNIGASLASAVITESVFAHPRRGPADDRLQ